MDSALTARDWADLDEDEVEDGIAGAWLVHRLAEAHLLAGLGERLVRLARAIDPAACGVLLVEDRGHGGPHLHATEIRTRDGRTLTHTRTDPRSEIETAWAQLDEVAFDVGVVLGARFPGRDGRWFGRR